MDEFARLIASTKWTPQSPCSEVRAERGAQASGIVGPIDQQGLYILPGDFKLSGIQGTG